LAWTGDLDDLNDWIAGNDEAIVARDQAARRATIAAVGEVA
jgi:hypothetical protein